MSTFLLLESDFSMYESHFPSQNVTKFNPSAALEEVFLQKLFCLWSRPSTLQILHMFQNGSKEESGSLNSNLGCSLVEDTHHQHF